MGTAIAGRRPSRRPAGNHRPQTGARVHRAGLGHGIQDVVDRLGCSPDGQARKHLDLILHNTAHTAFVLLVLDGEGRLVHVSVHHEQPLAEAARDRVLPALAREVALQGREVTGLQPRILPRLLDATDPLTALGSL